MTSNRVWKSSKFSGQIERRYRMAQVPRLVEESLRGKLGAKFSEGEW